MLDFVLTWLENSSPITKLLLGLFICAVSAIGFLANGRKAFYRRNQSGTEEFKSYGAMVVSRATEWVVYAISLAILLVGSILTVVGIGGLLD